MPTDLQKKDELRRELRLLELIQDTFKDVLDSEKARITHLLLNQRIEDIQKALED
ncbi:MAG: hypothetical protein FWG67_01865 [Defluviitaleaceae bacterium]|nr:hypothetical protein [Defluviitaleaceae bacterium]